MVTVQRSIYIEVPVQRVFDLLADPAAKAELNPLMHPIKVDVENGRRLHLGSHCYYRMQFANEVFDYRGEVTAFEDNRLIESRTDSEPSVTVRVTTMTENGGTRLTQVETFEASDAMLDGVKAHSFYARLFQLGQQIALWIDSDSMARYRSQREALLADELGAHLGRWLKSIKQHLEGSVSN